VSLFLKCALSHCSSPGQQPWIISSPPWLPSHEGKSSCSLMFRCSPYSSSFFPTKLLLFYFENVCCCCGCCFIHMCIQCLGHFCPLPPTPLLSPPTLRYQADTILHLSLLLLKREYKQ
jgi:hypothetical protein